MKIQHFIIIFLILILPFSILCRSKMSDYKLMLRDQVRLNNVIDSATQDSLDMLVELNDEFQMLYFNERFNITQELAKESVKSFFQTLAINFNMPYREGATESYFSMYVPAIVIVGYDGFFIYSVDQTTTGYVYKMSPKIPYTYYDEITGTVVHFSLGNHIKLYTNNKVYEGDLLRDYREDAEADYNEFYIPFDEAGYSEQQVLDMIPELTKSMSIIIEALHTVNPSYIPSFLYPDSKSDPNAVPLTLDYGSGDRDASEFHQIRRNVIIELIQDALREEMNEHTTYASIYGIQYNFALPDITDDDWRNSINDISVMSFIQGMPIGVQQFYNNYALSGSRIIQTEYIYGTTDKYYHETWCPEIADFFDPDTTDTSDVDNVFITRVQAAQGGYYPCKVCRP